MRFVILLVIVCLVPACEQYDQYPEAIDGVLDLREIPDPEHFMVKLNGEWEFYWKKMLRPNDFITGSHIPDYYGNVPSYWTSYPAFLGTASLGFATYRLRILLPPGFRNSLGIDLPVFDSSFDIYINGRYTGGNGITGRSAEESEPEYRRVFARIMPDSDILDIVVNVSNFDHRRGGFWLPARLGTFSEVQKKMANSWASEWSIISLLLGFSLLFIFFYFFSRREKIMLSFSLLSLGLALRPFFTAHYLINNHFSLPWDWIVRLEYIDLFLILISLSWFARDLYPSKFMRFSAWVLSTLCVFCFLATVILPVNVFTYSVYLFYPSVVLILVYLLVMAFRRAVKDQTTDIIYTIAFAGLLAAGLYDIVVSLGRSYGGSRYVIPGFVVVFVFIHAIFVLYRWVEAFHEKEKLKNKVEFMNSNLESLIRERTRELQKRNEEIEIQNSRIAMQNKQLSDTIQLRNKMFSVIAHDLRSPVVNILYMLNLLKEKEFQEKFDEFAGSSIDYAQRVINLLENMLLWGRGQEDKINYSPGHHDLADIILTNLSIFKETADQKDISVNFTQVGSPVAYCDRDLMDIIIRNLLSNAVKYTRRKGRISIFLKDRKNDESLMLKICDNGIGIPEDRQKIIFTSEAIQSTPGTENEKGTGLGLRLCHDLVRINKGSIRVESKPGEGTCFIICLPKEDISQPSCSRDHSFSES